MRVAGFPTFRKHWGKVEQDIEEGTYNIEIENKYDVSKHSGKKYIVITTVNGFGGKNHLLAIFFLIVAGLSVVLCIIFFIAYKRKQKALVIVTGNLT